MENSIAIANNEFVVKEYPIQDLTVKQGKTTERTQSQLTVTNKRIVYTQTVTDKRGGYALSKKDFDIRTIDTVDSDFSFKKRYSVPLIVFSAILILAGIVMLIAKVTAGIAPLALGAIFILLAVLLAKKMYAFTLVLSTFGSSETTHISLGESSLKPEKKKKAKKLSKRKLRRLKRKNSKVQDKGLFPDAIEAMVNEIGSYVIEFKKEA